MYIDSSSASYHITFKNRLCLCLGSTVLTSPWLPPLPAEELKRSAEFLKIHMDYEISLYLFPFSIYKTEKDIYKLVTMVIVR